MVIYKYSTIKNEKRNYHNSIKISNMLISPYLPLLLQKKYAYNNCVSSVGMLTMQYLDKKILILITISSEVSCSACRSLFLLRRPVSIH